VFSRASRAIVVACQVFQDRPVGCLGVGLGVALAYVPAARIPAAAADGGSSRHRFRHLIGARMERLDGEPIACQRHQPFVEVAALQHLGDQR
jgi:hypothetical protein